MAKLWQSKYPAIIASLTIIGLLTQSAVARQDSSAPTSESIDSRIVASSVTSVAIGDAPTEKHWGVRVPKDAMLTPSDLPPGYDKVSDRTVDTGGDSRLSYSYAYCGQPDGWPMHPHVGERLRTLLHTKKPDTMVTEWTVRFGSVEAARRQFAASSAAVRGCTPPIPGTGMRIERENFAGHESLLIRTEFGHGYEALHVLVRQGDLIAEVWSKPLPSEQDAVRVAQRAAARLSRATNG